MLPVDFIELKTRFFDFIHFVSKKEVNCFLQILQKILLDLPHSFGEQLIPGVTKRYTFGTIRHN